MNNQFLNQTIKFIEQSDLVCVTPCIRPIAFEKGGTHTVHLSLFDRMSVNKINENALLSQMIVFTLFDAFLDSVYPESEGLSFKKRYLNLPESTPIEIVTKEIYRIFKLVRNSMVHSRDSFNISASTVNICYNHNQTKFELTCKLSALQYMNSIVIALSKNVGVDDRYFELYLLSYYQELINSIDLFSDDITMQLKNVAPSLNFKHRVRYRVPVEVDISECLGEVELPEFSLNENEHWAGIDYVVESNSGLYIVPNEMLEGCKTIDQTLLSEWKVSNKNRFAM
ncbi:hypothetical protein F2K62_003901 [Vibrio fluvialis]|nr:hypothetical protein [Vibrio fluvialis]